MLRVLIDQFCANWEGLRSGRQVLLESLESV